MADVSTMTLPNGDVVNIKDSAGREAATTGLSGKVDKAQGVQNQGKILKVGSSGVLELVEDSVGTGDVVGPSSSTDDHVATFDGTTGKLIQDSGFTIGASVPADAVFTDTTYDSLEPEVGGTDESLVTTGEKATWNAKYDKPSSGIPSTDLANGVIPDISGKIDKEYIVPDDWSAKTWTGLTSPSGSYIWTDGENIYFSSESYQYVLDKSTSTWSAKTWYGLTSYINGDRIWTDGTNIYYSYNTVQFVLDKSTSTWSNKTWIELTSFSGEHIWTDGENIYYSNGSTQYVLNKSTSTWSTKTWTGLTNFWGAGTWTDGENIYYSINAQQYVLDKSSSTWSVKTWTGLTNLRGDRVWTDGENIYYSSSSDQYILNKSTSTWTAKTWTGLTSFSGQYIWSDGENIYYSDNSYGGNSNQYKFNKPEDQILIGHNGEFTAMPISELNFISDEEKGAPNGIAELDSAGKVLSSQLPSYVDDVLEYASLSNFPLTGESGKIYIAQDTNKTYRWSGSAYAEISESLALGETSSTAYRGDRGAAAYEAAVTNVDSTPTANSNHLVTSGGVAAAISSLPEGLIAEGAVVVQSGTTATTYIPTGTFVQWNGGIYEAAEDISLGDTLEDKLGPVPPDGILNGMQSRFNNYVTRSQGSGNAGKILGINASGNVEPMANSGGSDMTGATASEAGTHGLVPAPAAGEQNKVLSGGGTWEYMSAASEEFILDDVSNLGGSYSHTTTLTGVTADMKPLKIELSNPTIFNDEISVTCSNGSIMLACNDVSGTSTVKVTVIKMVNGDGQTVSSHEYQVLDAAKVDKVTGKGLSSNDYTDAEKNKLSGIAEGATAVSVVNNLNSDSTTSALSAAQGKVLNSKTDTYVISSNTLSNVESALVTFGATLGENEIHKIRFNISTATGVFSNQGYMGTIKNYGAGSRYVVEVQNCAYNGTGEIIIGNYYEGSWKWDTVALNSNFKKLQARENETNDILVDALNVSGTKFFSGSGSAYTGTVPNTNYKYGTFRVDQRSATRMVTAYSADNGVAINTYNGSSWLGWEELVLNSNFQGQEITNFFTPSTGITVSQQYMLIVGRLHVLTLRLQFDSANSSPRVDLGTISSTYAKQDVVRFVAACGKTFNSYLNIVANGFISFGTMKLDRLNGDSTGIEEVNVNITYYC